MPSEQESLDGQEQERTRTAGQETVAHASAMAEHAGRAQAAQDTAATATYGPSGVGAGP